MTPNIKQKLNFFSNFAEIKKEKQINPIIIQKHEPKHHCTGKAST